MRPTTDARPGAERPSASAMAAQLVDLCRTADPDVVRQGAEWYPSAHAEASRLAEAYGPDVPRAAGVIAALSPRLRWWVNVREAGRCLAGERPTAIGANVRKAEAIRDRVGHWADILGGPKTRAFAATIENPDHPTAVVVDTWALRAAGWPTETVTPKQYDVVAEAYRLAAKDLGWLPSATQATAWILTRGSAQ